MKKVEENEFTEADSVRGAVGDNGQRPAGDVLQAAGLERYRRTQQDNVALLFLEIVAIARIDVLNLHRHERPGRIVGSRFQGLAAGGFLCGCGS